MTEALVISSQPPEYPGMDYSLLRREAINYIEKLGGDYWTDYNASDPGITILEALCYAITDLSYRLSIDISDILAEPPNVKKNGHRQFFTARQILTVNPVTIEDFRKLIIDIDGVRNAWLETVEGPSGTKGYYTVYIEPEDRATNDYSGLVEKVRVKLLAHRNLCEDFLAISVLPLENIKVRADVSIENDADAAAVLAQIYTRLADFISPAVPFLTLGEMFARGYRSAEIFEGPPLEHGFIDVKYLQAAERKTQLHASDLIRLIQDIPGVKVVDNLKMSGATGKWHDWVLDIAPGYTPRWEKGNDIRLFKGNMSCNIVEKCLEQNQLSIDKKIKKTTVRRGLDIIPSSGNYRSLDEYETIQNELPLNYGVGHFGLPEDALQQRKARANQLRGYLMLFDQVMANYLSQLEHAKNLFSLDGYPQASYSFNMLPEDVESRAIRKSGYNSKEETFIVKLLQANSEEINDVLEPLATAHKRRESLGDELQAIIEEPHAALKRNNRFLNHLLARYAEEFADVSVLYRESDVSGKYLSAKQEFLQKYPLVSTGRAVAFDYPNKCSVWDSDNVSGLERRIALKIGIVDFKRRRLAAIEQEGFHFIEHILLLEVDGQKDKTAAEKVTNDATGYRDDYSFHVSFVFPDWIGRFRDEAFRRFAEEIIWAETPAHIHASVHWRNIEFFKEFEKWYEIWQQQKAGGSLESPGPAEKLIELLGISRAEKS